MEKDSVNKITIGVGMNQVMDAQRYVFSYYDNTGGDKYSIDWEKRPKNLPEDVSKAWDVIDAFRKQVETQGVILV